MSCPSLLMYQPAGPEWDSIYWDVFRHMGGVEVSGWRVSSFKATNISEVDGSLCVDCHFFKPSSSSVVCFSSASLFLVNRANLVMADSNWSLQQNPYKQNKQTKKRSSLRFPGFVFNVLPDIKHDLVRGEAVLFLKYKTHFHSVCCCIRSNSHVWKISNPKRWVEMSLGGKRFMWKRKK